MPVTRFAVAAVFAAAAVAQVPTDGVLVLEANAQLMQPNYRIVDALGRGAVTVRGQNVFVSPSPTSVGVDPTQPGHFWFQTATSSLPGTWRSELGLLAQIGTTTWGPWATLPCDRIEVGPSQVFVLRGGLVEARPKAGGAATTLFTLSGAIDLACDGARLYVASAGGGVPRPLVEYDLATGQQRTVGSYADVRAVAASPLGNELALGLTTGAVVRIDPTSGAVVGQVTSGLGPIVAVDYTRYGTLVWADAQQVGSELVATPIWSAIGAIVDIGVCRQQVASIVPFGTGCGVGAPVQWRATSPPALGNTAFVLGIANAPVNSIAILLVGASRSFSSVFGGALPADLGPIGAMGCWLLADPVVLFALPTTALGTGTQPFPIPATPGLAGIEWSAQWLLPDPSVGALGLATSDGAAFLIN